MSELLSDTRDLQYFPLSSIILATIFLKGVKKSDSWQKWLNWQCWAALKKGPFFKFLLFFREVILALHKKIVSIRVYATSRKEN